MLYRALVSFAGIVTMGEGEVREISDSALANDLLKAGYIKAEGKAEDEPKKEKKTSKK